MKEGVGGLEGGECCDRDWRLGDGELVMLWWNTIATMYTGEGERE
jgi:hypothetical protein